MHRAHIATRNKGSLPPPSCFFPSPSPFFRPGSSPSPPPLLRCPSFRVSLKYETTVWESIFIYRQWFRPREQCVISPRGEGQNSQAYKESVYLASFRIRINKIISFIWIYSFWFWFWFSFWFSMNDYCIWIIKLINW